MKKINKDFELFQKEFKRHQKLFGLTGYETYFKHEARESGYAAICINHEDMVATVTLNSDIPDKHKPQHDIRKSAKHEAIHLLIGRLEQYGADRYLTRDIHYEASEELVNKLMNLIPQNPK